MSVLRTIVEGYLSISRQFRLECWPGSHSAPSRMTDKAWMRDRIICRMHGGRIFGMLDSWRPSGLDIPVQPDVTLTVAKSHGCGYGIEKNMSQVFPSRDRKHATVKA